MGASLALGPAGSDLFDNVLGLDAIYAPYQNVKGHLRDLWETSLDPVQRLLDLVKSTFD